MLGKLSKIAPASSQANLLNFLRSDLSESEGGGQICLLHVHRPHIQRSRTLLFKMLHNLLYIGVEQFYMTICMHMLLNWDLWCVTLIWSAQYYACMVQWHHGQAVRLQLTA